MTPDQDEAARQRGHEIANLKDRWGDLFRIGHDGTCYFGVDRRTGATVRHSTAQGLSQALWAAAIHM